MKTSFLTVLCASLVMFSTVFSHAYACNGEQCEKDANISLAVKKQIDALPSLAMNQITVETVNGVVYLHGRVDNGLEERNAVQAAHVDGVKQIIDNISVINN